MLFWAVVLVLVAVVLVLAWRIDRSRNLAITRRHGAAENDIAAGEFGLRAFRNDDPGNQAGGP